MATPHETLAAVRTELLALHQSLLHAERAELERSEGAITPNQFLQLLIQDPRFAWLRPITELIVQMDEAVAAARKGNAPLDAAQAGPLLDQARALIAMPSGASDFATRYQMWLGQDAALRDAHGRVDALLSARA